MHIIAVANRKGGVGKSSVATHLAAAFGIQGWRVLMLDMDSQASTSSMLVDELADDALTTTQLLLGEARLPDIIRPSVREQVWLAPAASDLTQAQFAIAGRTGRETILRRALREVSGFDVVLIDTAPELQLATLNSLVASSHVLLPFTPDPKALEGLETTCDAVAEIAAAELAHPAILGCVQVAYDRRLAVTDESRRQVKSAYGALLFDTCIRANSSFIVCPAWHRDIFAMEQKERGKNRGSADYLALSREVAERLPLAAAHGQARSARTQAAA